jgi:hypothetical protein
MVSPTPRPAREPIFNVPAVVLLSILLLVGIHALRAIVLSDLDDLEFVLNWAVVPARWAVAFGGVQPDEILSALGAATSDGEPSFQAELARYILVENDAKPWTGVTYTCS